MSANPPPASAPTRAPVHRLAVVLSGRFQPFHRGHHAAFLHLQERFGPEQVWLASSDRGAEKPGRPAPFSFLEKQRIITGLFGVPAERVVQIKSPYAPAEVLAAQDRETTAYVAALGSRDADRLKSRYWAPFSPDEPLLPYPERGYVLVLPPMADDLSASQIRATLGSETLSAHAKETAFRAWYPRFDAQLFQLLTERLTEKAQKPRQET